MATTLGSTGITFPDATTQTTAATGGVTSLNGQTGAITDTTVYAIGSYISGRPANTTNYATDSTIAGSSLYQVPTGVIRSASDWQIGTSGGVSAVLVNTGTWRAMTASAYFSSNAWGLSGLWVRIS